MEIRIIVFIEPVIKSYNMEDFVILPWFEQLLFWHYHFDGMGYW